MVSPPIQTNTGDIFSVNCDHSREIRTGGRGGYGTLLDRLCVRREVGRAISTMAETYSHTSTCKRCSSIRKEQCDWVMASATCCLEWSFVLCVISFFWWPQRVLERSVGMLKWMWGFQAGEFWGPILPEFTRIGPQNSPAWSTGVILVLCQIRKWPVGWDYTKWS